MLSDNFSRLLSNFVTFLATVLSFGSGNTRIFNYKDRARLLIILRAKKLGFTLKEIKTYLDLYEVDPSQKVQSKNALEAISQRLFQLEDQKKEINIIIKELKILKNDILKTL